MRRCAHYVYYLLGYIVHTVLLLFWRVRDKLLPPKEDAILFIAHPDDDTLFFHSFIKEHKPYVVLMTDGWSLRRLPCFMKAMKKYRVKYRAYNLKSRDERIDLLERYIEEAYKTGDYNTICTHNSTGEYGHEMHVKVHDAVKKVIGSKILVPVDKEHISAFSLSEEEKLEKEIIFKTIYTTELFVLDQYKEWVDNEKLVQE